MKIEPPNHALNRTRGHAASCAATSVAGPVSFEPLGGNPTGDD